MVFGSYIHEHSRMQRVRRKRTDPRDSPVRFTFPCAARAAGASSQRAVGFVLFTFSCHTKGQHPRRLQSHPNRRIRRTHLNPPPSLMKHLSKDSFLHLGEHWKMN